MKIKNKKYMNTIKKDNKLFWIYVLSASIYFVQGIEGIPNLALFAYLKEKLHLDPSTIMYLGSIIGISWLIKPLWGYLCDNGIKIPYIKINIKK